MTDTTLERQPLNCSNRRFAERMYQKRKLTLEQAREARELYAAGWTQCTLAERYGLYYSPMGEGTQAISLLVRGRTYKDAGGPIAQMKSAAKRKLTLDQAREIYQRYWRPDGPTESALAREYGCLVATIWGIVNRATYRDATEDLK